MAAHLEAADPTSTVTNGQVATAKSVRIAHLAWLYRTEPYEVHAVNRLCWEWAKGFSLAIAKDPNLDPLTPVDILRSPLDEPNRAAADAILDAAMAAFAEHGITPAGASDGARRVPLSQAANAGEPQEGEPIIGAFGIALGEPLPAGAILLEAEFSSTPGGESHAVIPPISNGDFPKVVVTLDPETRRVSEIDAYSRALTGEACLARRDRLEAAIERKYGTRPSFIMNSHAHNRGSRAVVLGCHDFFDYDRGSVITLRLRYVDRDLSRAMEAAHDRREDAGLLGANGL